MQKTICSIFFQPLEAKRPYSPDGRSAWLKTFRMPAAEPGKYELYTVDTFHEAQRDGSRPAFITPVYPDHLADCLVNEWRNNRAKSDFGRPGIFVCAGDAPTPEELTHWREQQDLWAEAWFLEAQDMDANGGSAGITRLHRACAEYLGRMEPKWVYATDRVSLKPCPLCSERIDERAMKCSKCGNVVDFDRWFDYEQKRTEAEAKLLAMRKKILGEGSETAAPPPAPKIAPPLKQPVSMGR